MNAVENARAAEDFGLQAYPPAHADRGNWHAHWRIDKYHNDRAPDGNPDEVVEVSGNLLLNAGITRMLDKLIGTSGQVYDASHCRIGVGDSSTAASASQTDLQASTNKYYKLCDSVAVSGQTLTVIATFGSGVANFAWAEFGIDAGTADGSSGTAVMLNRKVASVGTKGSGSTWVFTVTLTIS